MKYKLKNKDLQMMLDKLTEGKFSKSLEEGIDPSDYFRRFDVKGIQGMSISLNHDNLEGIKEYNPSTWNVWPEIKPPKNKLMRLEIWEPAKNVDTPESVQSYVRERLCAFFNEYSWVDSDGYIIEDYRLKNKKVLFRPWVDPDEKENE